MTRVIANTTFLIFTLILLITSVSALDPIGVKAVSSWKLDSLPCRALSYDLELSNNDNVVHTYAISVDKYAQYVKFSSSSLVIEAGMSAPLKVDVTLPCSVSGEVELLVKVKPVGFNYAAQFPLFVNIKPDYSREISIAPLEVCQGEEKQGFLEVSNPSTTPNMFLIQADLPRWIRLDANKVVLPPKAETKFSFTILADSKVGETPVTFAVKDFSGVEEIPFNVNVKNCKHEFILNDKSIIAVSGMNEKFNLPVSGSGDFKLTIQGPEWVTLETKELKLNDEQQFITLSVDATFEGVESGDYEVLIIAKNGETVTEKLNITVSSNSVVKFVRNYALYIIAAIIVLLLLVKVFFFRGKKAKKEEPKVEKVEEKKADNKEEAHAFDKIDMETYVPVDSCKTIAPIVIDRKPFFTPFKKLILFVLVFIGLLCLIWWQYAYQIMGALYWYQDWCSSVWLQAGNYLAVAYNYVANLGADALYYVGPYSWYIVAGLAVVILVIILDHLHMKGSMKAVHHFFFEEVGGDEGNEAESESQVNEKVYDMPKTDVPKAETNGKKTILKKK
ncbi:MAG: hypothetical protein WC471_04530 [Candidatus Woesearchaeota archaeon]